MRWVLWDNKKRFTSIDFHYTSLLGWIGMIFWCKKSMTIINEFYSRFYFNDVIESPNLQWFGWTSNWIGIYLKKCWLLLFNCCFCTFIKKTFGIKLTYSACTVTPWSLNTIFAYPKCTCISPCHLKLCVLNKL